MVFIVLTMTYDKLTVLEGFLSTKMDPLTISNIFEVFSLQIPKKFCISV